MKKIAKNKGFTLIEILVVIGIIALLAAIVIIAINPARQFAQARNSQRTSNVNSILNAIGQNIADNKGIFTCGGTAYTISATAVSIEKGTVGGDIRSCIVPTYITEIPIDPTSGTNTCESSTACSTGSYDTGYTVVRDASGRITVAAPTAATASELSQTISVTR